MAKKTYTFEFTKQEINVLAGYIRKASKLDGRTKEFKNILPIFVKHFNRMFKIVVEDIDINEPKILGNKKFKPYEIPVFNNSKHNNL